MNKARLRKGEVRDSRGFWSIDSLNRRFKRQGVRVTSDEPFEACSLSFEPLNLTREQFAKRHPRRLRDHPGADYWNRRCGRDYKR